MTAAALAIPLSTRVLYYLVLGAESGGALAVIKYWGDPMIPPANYPHRGRVDDAFSKRVFTEAQNHLLHESDSTPPQQPSNRR